MNIIDNTLISVDKNIYSFIVPDNVNNINEDVFNNCINLKLLIIKNKEYKTLFVDGDLFIINQTKKVSDYIVYKGFIFNKMINNIIDSTNCFVANRGDFYAHGTTSKKAISDLIFKINRNEIEQKPIDPEELMTIQRYRDLTGACELGVTEWMRKNNIKEGMKLKDIIPVLEKTNAYGFNKIKL